MKPHARGQLRLFVAVYLLYLAGRWATGSDMPAALAHARWVVDLEHRHRRVRGEPPAARPRARAAVGPARLAQRRGHRHHYVFDVLAGVLVALAGYAARPAWERLAARGLVAVPA